MFILLLISLSLASRIGIISAMDEELALIKQNMIVEKTDTIARRVYLTGKLYGMDCTCVIAGVGEINAALTAEILVSHYHVDAVIFSGVAGGINPELRIGDIVISKKVLHHDYGLIAPDNFSPFDTIGFAADSFLVETSVEAAKRVEFAVIPSTISSSQPHTPICVIGRVATGDQFIASEEKRKWLEKTFAADCVEMEGVAVAQVCAINKVPFVIIRCLSDQANEKADVDFEAFLPYAVKNSSLLVGEIVRSLHNN